MITDKINNNLEALFDPINDDIYKSLICNRDNYPDPSLSLRDKTIVYNSFDDSSDMGHDDSDHQVDGVCTDIVSITGVYGDAALFNGSTSKISYGIIPLTKTPFSFSCRFFIDSATGGLDPLIAISNADESIIYFSIFHYNGYILIFTTDALLVVPDTVITTEVWNFLYIQIENENYKINLNGVEYIGIFPEKIEFPENVYLWSGSVSNIFFTNGIIDEFYLFNSILTDEEIQYIYTNPGTNIHYSSVIPTDFQIGAIASQIEYLRKLSIDLIKQIFIDQAAYEFLKYQLNNFFNSLQAEGETNKAWVSRTIALVLQTKVSRASIIYALRPYSSQEPEINFVYNESAYADFCYADIYIDDPDQLVLPAIAEEYDSQYFTIKITLYDTDTSDITTVYEILAIMIAAGISYILEVIYT